MVLLLLLSGLLIGFVLGYHDLYNLFSARVSKSNSKSAWYLVISIAIAVLFGAITNIDGTLKFVANLADTNQIQVAFLITTSALITIALLRLKFRIISISHAVIGSITGWLLFAGVNLPVNKLLVIVIIWLLTPIISGVLSASYLTILKSFIRKSQIHILKISRTLQLFLSMALLMAAYSIGANNIANVVGVYVPIFKTTNIQVLQYGISGEMALVVVGSILIAMGLATRILLKSNQQKLEIFEFSPETNFSVLLAFATVFFLFSSTIFQDLIGNMGWAYPLVPISALHILTAGVVGVSYKKGFNIYQKDAFANLAFGSLLTPIMSGLIMFVSALGFNTIWGSLITSTGESNPGVNIADQDYIDQYLTIHDSSVIYNMGIILFLSAIIISGILIYMRLQKSFKIEREKFYDNKAELEAEREFFKKELEYSEDKAQTLQQEIYFKNKELEKFAFNLLEKEEILNKTKDILSLVKKSDFEANKKKVISELSNLMLNNLNLSNDKINFYQQIDAMNKDFYIRLSQQFNNLTNNDKRLIALLKLGLSSKEISSLVNISTKSVEMNRYRLRQKLNLLNDQNLLDFVNNI
ncbi:MAG: inorganic phosphate transporter [Bacteroidota bacterium]